MFDELIAKMLDQAGNETTHDGVALTAVRMAYKRLRASGLTFVDLQKKMAGAQAASPTGMMTTGERYRRMAEQEEEILALRAKLAAANRDLDRALKARIPARLNRNGTMSFHVFRSEIRARVGRHVNLSAAFQAQTGTSAAQMARWEKSGEVPQSAVVLLDLLKPLAAQEGAREKWSAEVVARLTALREAGENSATIAQILTGEFGMPFTQSAIRHKLSATKTRT